ncbi:MAG: hypothetical protein EWM45_08105 [Rhodopseudomonas palustris]|nr:MAG: hypothetical protein EWM45_08105 [Rhodopseudomonas palustris]
MRAEPHARQRKRQWPGDPRPFLFLSAGFLSAGFLSAGFLSADFQSADFQSADFQSADFQSADFLSSAACRDSKRVARS